MDKEGRRETVGWKPNPYYPIPWEAPPALEQGRPLLIVDLDETLWYGTEMQAPVGASRQIQSLYRGIVHFDLRPGAAEFLKRESERFQIGIWTAAGTEWAEHGLQQTGLQQHFDPCMRWSATRCTQRMDWRGEGERIRVKRLSKLRRALKRCGIGRGALLILDDSPEAWPDALGNLLRCPRWKGPDPDVSHSHHNPFKAISTEIDRIWDKRGEWHRTRKGSFAP